MDAVMNAATQYSDTNIGVSDKKDIQFNEDTAE